MLILTVLVPLFHRYYHLLTPVITIYGSLLSLIVLLAVFWLFLQRPGSVSVFGFYLLVDIYSVILVECLWSLINASFDPASGKRWYGVIASGGLLGGAAGSYLASTLLDRLKLAPVDLILVSSLFWLLLLPLFRRLFAHGVTGDRYNEEKNHAKRITSDIPNFQGGREVAAELRAFPYLRLVASLLLLAQIIEPIVEYQFLNAVEAQIATLSERTQYLSEIFTALSVLALFVNLALMPVIHRIAGILGGLSLQPIALAFGAVLVLFWRTLPAIALLKIFDRGLAYSSGRASRELLYIPLDTRVIFRGKAWIDVYGYRSLKIFGSVLVLILSRWLPEAWSSSVLYLVILSLAVVWFVAIAYLRRYLQQIEPPPVAVRASSAAEASTAALLDK